MPVNIIDSAFVISKLLANLTQLTSLAYGFLVHTIKTFLKCILHKMQMLRVLVSPEVRIGQTICMQMHKAAAAESFNINI